MPRIWGEWKSEFYGSGTTIVVQREVPDKPHLYIYADTAVDDSRYMRDRYEMCKQIAEFMNGGERPSWIDDFERITECQAVSVSGGMIFATGPSYDADPPKLDWRQDESEEARNDRARLMDALFLSKA